MSTKVVCLIPARGGSKGIPRKNIMEFCGRPLLAWSILQSIESSCVDEVYVTSDDTEILQVAKSYGALVVRRPPELATDTASAEAALLHALDTIERPASRKIEVVVFLQATSPLREPSDIDGAVEKLLKEGADSLLSMSVPGDLGIFTLQGNELKGLTFDPFNRVRRQDRESIYLENGSIWVFRPESLRKCNNRLGGKISMFELPAWKSFEIDRYEDIEVCEYYFRTKVLPYWREKEVVQLISEVGVDLIVYDFDGVMTDNRVLTLQDGTEAVLVNRSDGLGVEMLKRQDIPQVIISTESNEIVAVRAQKLDLPVFHDCKDKVGTLKHLCEERDLDVSKVVYVGNDVNDLAAMKTVGFPVAPADAHPEVKAVSKLVLSARGGEGVIRELADKIRS